MPLYHKECPDEVHSRAVYINREIKLYKECDLESESLVPPIGTTLVIDSYPGMPETGLVKVLSLSLRGEEYFYANPAEVNSLPLERKQGPLAVVKLLGISVINRHPKVDNLKVRRPTERVSWFRSLIKGVTRRFR